MSERKENLEKWKEKSLIITSSAPKVIKIFNEKEKLQTEIKLIKTLLEKT